MVWWKRCSAVVIILIQALPVRYRLTTVPSFYHLVKTVNSLCTCSTVCTHVRTDVCLTVFLLSCQFAVFCYFYQICWLDFLFISISTGDLTLDFVTIPNMMQHLRQFHHRLSYSRCRQLKMCLRLMSDSQVRRKWQNIFKLMLKSSWSIREILLLSRIM